MSLTKKIVMGAGAMTVGLGLLAVFGVGSAVAKSTPTGTVTCTSISGSISFSPALSNAGGAASEKATVKATVSGCSGGSPTPTKGTVSAVIQTKLDTCTGLLSPPPTQSETFTTTWSPSSAGKSVAVYGPQTAITSPDVGFALSNGTVSGSYAGKGSATVLSNETDSTFLAACATKTGVKSVTLASGKIVL